MVVYSQFVWVTDFRHIFFLEKPASFYIGLIINLLLSFLIFFVVIMPIFKIIVWEYFRVWMQEIIWLIFLGWRFNTKIIDDLFLVLTNMKESSYLLSFSLVAKKIVSFELSPYEMAIRNCILISIRSINNIPPISSPEDTFQHAWVIPETKISFVRIV